MNLKMTVLYLACVHVHQQTDETIIVLNERMLEQLAAVAHWIGALVAKTWPNLLTVCMSIPNRVSVVYTSLH